MKILALIVARGGSKRLPGKNIKVLGGKPLINWSIDLVKNIKGICDVMVSTDDASIAEIAANSGALVPWLRPEYLARDDTPSVDVVIHATKWYEAEKGNLDGVLLLQPTSPYRNRDDICRGIKLYQDNHYETVIGVSPLKFSLDLVFKINNGLLEPYINQFGENYSVNSSAPAYKVNGSFYLASPKNLEKNKSYYGSKMIPLVMNQIESAIDIDTEADWKMAELCLVLLSANNVSG